MRKGVHGMEFDLMGEDAATTGVVWPGRLDEVTREGRER